jgi:thymidylate synthase (FAD)
MDATHTVPLYGDGKGHVTLVHYSGNDLSAVNAARVSFGAQREKLNDKDIKLLSYLAKHRHTSPFEHASISFRVKVPLFVARQWMRHRTQSFNEISRRYTSVDIDFFVPAKLRKQHKSNRQASEGVVDDPNLIALYDAQLTRALATYEHLIAEGVCREQARAILPQAMYTEFIVTANLLNWLKFIELRDHEGAQAEIIEAARAVRSILETLYPHTTKAWFDR